MNAGRIVPLVLLIVLALTVSAGLSAVPRADTQGGDTLQADTYASLSGPRQDGVATLTWLIETIDSAVDAGTSSAMALYGASHLHVAYQDAGNNTLKYATFDGATWHVEELDTTGNEGGYVSIAVDSAGHPHISYFDLISGNLEYTYHDGTSWHTETVDSRGIFTSIAIGSDDQPRISYYQETSTSLKFARRECTPVCGWSDWTVDNTGTVGRYSSLALDDLQRPHISYCDDSNDELRYATHDGSTWSTEPVDGSGPVLDGMYTSITLGGNNHPRISYHYEIDELNSELRYAYHDGSSWHIEIVDSSAAKVGTHTSLALDPAGNPHISYRDATAGALKCAFHDGSSWSTETVDSDGNGGLWTSLVLDPMGQPHIAYFEQASGDLKHASDVPLRYVRIAADHVEQVRGTGMAPGWDLAQLGSQVRPVYRPDIEGVAYYEFLVVVPGADDPEKAGFVMVSTGEHDVPIPLWNFEQDTPTHLLKAMAEEKSEIPARYYNLDALTYTAENESGELVATLGQLPVKMSGMDPSWLDGPPTFDFIWTPSGPAQDDGTAPGMSGTLFISGTIDPPPSLQRGEWASWDELKADYANTYDILIDAWRQGAEELWAVEDRRQEGSLLLHKGDTRTLTLLWPGVQVSLAGAGKTYVDTQLISRPGLAPLFRIDVLDSELGETLPLVVTAAYDNGVTEVFDYHIVEDYQVWLPLVARSGQSGANTISTLETGARIQLSCDGWTSWSYSWAGGDSDQRWYEQLDPYEDPNTAKCYSGCGATAWAMLFGWADYQADVGNPYWDGRWGLYREDGGYGNDAVAPYNMTDGVKNMTWEIRNHIDTWCGYNCGTWLGATWASDMDEARGYLEDRSYTSIRAKGNNVSIPEKRCRDLAANTIRDRNNPAIVGIGAWEHYPLAYGYARRKWVDCLGTTWARQKEFYVNMGWGCCDKSWVNAYTVWFGAEIRPYSTVETNEVDDVVLYRTSDNHWYFDYHLDGDFDAVGGAWGIAEDDYLPCAGDFDRDGLQDDVGIYSPSSHEWAFDYDRDGDTDHKYFWGWDDALPLAGDFDRDGQVDDVALLIAPLYAGTPPLWCYDYDRNNDQLVCDEARSWGQEGDLPFAGDFDNDGYVDDVALLRPSDHKAYYDFDHDADTDDDRWYLVSFPAWPVAGDFDLDGTMDDVAFYSPEWTPEPLWWIYPDQGFSGATAREWGWADGIPAAGAFGITHDPY